MSDSSQRISQLARAARRAGLRLRASEVADRITLLSIVVLVWSAGLLTAIKVGWVTATSRPAAVGSAACLSLFLAGVLHAALRKRPSLEGALALDRHHGLSGRVTNALVFSKTPRAQRTGLMEAAVEDALAVTRDLSPRRAVPLRVPRGAFAALALLAAVVALALLEVPVTRPLPPPAPHIDALAMSPDDVELFRRLADEVDATAKDPTAIASARRLNQLLEDVAQRRVDRQEVFRRLDEIERGLGDRPDADAAAVENALDGMAKELDKSALGKPVAQALADRRYAEAEQAMKDLAKKVENAKRDVDKAKLEALRQALQKSSEVVKHETSSRESERQEAEEQRKRLLKKKEQQGLSQSEQRELDKLERKLEHLDREKQRSDKSSEALSGLDRDLAKAAQELMKDLGASSKDLQQGAEDLHRSAQRQMSEQEKQQLKQRIEELRQILRQEGQAGKDRIKRMLQFGARARGQQGERSQGQGQGQGQRQGQGSQGSQGQGSGRGQQLTLGQGAPGEGSAVMMMPGGSMPGGQGSDPGQAGGGAGKGEEWGSGHDPNVRGDATRMQGHTEDVTAAAADTGQGASTSEVIHGAAQRGFVGRGYQKVFTDYHGVAEQALSHDEVPPGYRFYVRRYFQLIRPRD